MKNEDILIGSHVSMATPDFYLGSVQEALSYGANAFMFYTGAPQNSYRKPLEELKIKEGYDLIKKAGLDETKIVVHAPYIINLANRSRPELYQSSKDMILKEIRRTSGFHVSVLVLHPGAYVSQAKNEAIAALVDALDEVLDIDGTNVKIAIETMAGKGTEIGTTFEEVRQIINASRHQDRLGACLDTCHINDAGYDVHDVDHVLKKFDEIIGLNRLLVVHLNDSKNEKGAHKDRHENIGYGTIGFETLSAYAHHPLLVNVPKILETPYVNGRPPYKEEIKMLKENRFEQNWKQNF
ncbi:MAG TPA: deoxyribonuclease IV [Bacilli bacterium]|nr:deoxyribonuclease IV [Bacilli bacterium]